MASIIYSNARKIILFLFFIVLSNFVFSQGNACSSAVNVTVNGTCPSGTISDATINDPTYAGSCSISPTRDGWYSFTATATTATVVAISNNRQLAVAIYSNTCGSLVQIGCANANTTAGGQTETVNLTGLTIGAVYYVRIINESNNSLTLNSLCITSPVVAPTNDNCTGATVISVSSGTSCTTLAGGTVLGATTSTNANTCSGTADDDVWYSFVATSTSHSVTLSNVAGSVTDMYHSVYDASGGCGSIGTPLVCSDPNTSLIGGLTIGATYYIRIYTYTSTSGQNTTFSVCVTTPPPPPSNDDPNTATVITAGASCSYTTFTNASATGSTCGTIPAPGCASYSGGDVWFSVTVPASGAITFSTQSAVVTDGGMAIYSGTPCGVLTLISCNDDVVGNMPAIALSGQTPGTTLYVRFWEYGNDNNGTFGLCATIITPPANDNCSGATAFPAVPTNGTCANLTNQSTANASASGVTPTGACTSNSGTSDDDVWFSFVATGTTMNLTGTWVSGSTDVYWQVFSGACSTSMTSLLCTDTDAGGILSGLTVGQTYYIRLYTYGSAVVTTQNICLSVIPDPCSSITNITSCGSAVSTVFTAGTGAYPSSSCGFTTGGYEKIYTYTPPTTGNYNIQQASSFAYIDYQIKAVSAGCGSTGWTCIQDLSGASTSAVFTMTAGVQYYILLDPESTAGGSVTFSIVCAPTPPANDDCTGAYTLTPNAGTVCTSQTGGTLVGATASSYSNACSGSADDDVWYSFVATSTTHSISINNVAGSTTDLYHSVYAGTCGAPGAPLVCSDPNSSYIGGLTIGQTYFIRIFSYTSTLGQTTTFSVCVTTIIPPNNDECSGAYPVTVNSGTVCTTQTGGTLVNASQSNVVNSCGGTADDDVWYSFVATAATHSISINNVAGSTTDLYHSVFAGTCGTLSAAFICSDPNTSLVGGLTIGQTYYIRIFSYTSTTGQTSTFSVCITTPTMVTPPANNNCSGATSVSTNTGTTCSLLTGGTLVGATSSTIANTCGGTADDDVWYSFVATSTSHSVTLSNVAGSTTDLYHSVYGGTCGSVGPPLVCSDPNSSSVYGLTIGNVYYIRVFSYTSTFGQTSTFSVCVTTLPPTGVCGNPANNDYCSNPASLTQGAGTFSSSTSSIYSADQTSPLSGIFCGSIENNSWYTFVATASTASFPFTSVAGCTNGWGVQGQVFSVTTSGLGCCNAFTSVSNCYNPATTSLGTVTATGLNVGQSYVLMIDGNAGDVCNFTISGWTATGILPLELLTFVGRNEDEKNKLQWVTGSEKNTDYFSLEKSKDGMAFDKIVDVKAYGNSNSSKNYNAFDMSPYEEITYYRLKLFYLDGSSEYSNIIAIDNKNLTNYMSNVRPNPTNSNIEFDINTKAKEKVVIQLYNNTGSLMSLEEQQIDAGYQSLNLDLSKYETGIYLLKVTFENSGKTEIQKIIKN